jgi:hypothetical protein
MAWAEESGLRCVEAPASLQVKDARGTIVRLFPTFRTIQFPLEELWSDGMEEEARRILDRLTALARGKSLGEKEPSIPCTDAVEHWDAIVEVMEQLRATRDAPPST